MVYVETIICPAAPTHTRRIKVRPLLKHLATMLADRQAVTVILDECPAVVIGGIVWRDTMKPKTAKNVIWETKYLHLRGLLARHPTQTNLVKIRGFDHEKK